MSVSEDVVTFVNINALSEAVMLIDNDGKFVAANSAFYELTGIVRGVFPGKRLYKLPFATKEVERGLVRLFIKASRNDGYNGTYLFPHVYPNGTVVNVSASARKTMFDSQECIMFNFKQLKNEDDQTVYADSWKYCMELSYEPYLEFHPAEPIPLLDTQENRLEFLHTLGESLQVRISNKAAAAFYADNQETLEGRTFLSFFSKESDAIGFLDMLSAVGHMKYETNVNTRKALGVHVEMDCLIRFNDDGNIAVLYCSQRNLSVEERYKANKFEIDFMFNQPFVGYAFLAPPRPLERPSTENLDTMLDEMLDQIVVVRANQTILGLYGLDRTKLLMKPIRGFFHDPVTARHALKELFVMRETSLGLYNTQGDDFELIAIFRGIFDDLDRLSGVLIAASKHSLGYNPRHTNKQPAYEEGKVQDSLLNPEGLPKQEQLSEQVQSQNNELRHTYDPTYDPFSFLK